MKQGVFFLLLMILFAGSSLGQTSDYDSLKKEILFLKVETEALDLRMKKSQKRFQSGIIVSALGYSTTIAGGMMLGRENDQLGQVLLVSGGATGILGTILLTDAFAVLAGKKKKR